MGEPKLVNYEVFKIEIENIKEDMQEFKESTKEYIKEIREDSKEDRKMFQKSIDTLNRTNISLQENIVKLTNLVERADERSLYQEQRLDRIDNKLDSTNKELLQLSSHIDKGSNDENLKWHQNMIEQHGKWMFWVIAALLLGLGAILGIKFDDIVALLHK